MSLKSLKHYRIGDIIMTSKPLVYVVVDQMKSRLCDYCLSVKPTLICCTDCQQMFYCNQICQQNDWSYHRFECNTYANSPHLKSATKIMIRLWLMIENNESIADKPYALPNGQFLSLNEMKVNDTIDKNIVKLIDESKDESFFGDIEDLSESISIKDMAFIQFKALVQTFNDCKLDADLTKLWILFIKVWSNVLKIDVFDSDIADNAYGLYVEVSALSHCCEPNACYVSYGTQLQVRAIKAIKPKQTITISYVDISDPKPIRQQFLKSFFIDCHCLKCETNSDSHIDYEVFHKLNNDFLEAISESKGEKNVDYQHLLDSADKLVPFYDLVYLNYYPEMSVFLYKYLQIMLLNVRQTKCNLNEEFLSFVLKSVRITHGMDHKLYRKLPVIENITLLQLETDCHRVVKALKANPPSGAMKLITSVLILFIIVFAFYYSNDLF